MYAARWTQRSPGATVAPIAELRTPKIDRLDLLARMMVLRDDCVAQALSPASDAGALSFEGGLLDEAEQLGRQWAITDPVDGGRLAGTLLTGLSAAAERFEDGYADAVRHGRARASLRTHATRGRLSTYMPANGHCDACRAHVAVLLGDLASDETTVACPCCGHPWNR